MESEIHSYQVEYVKNIFKKVYCKKIIDYEIARSETFWLDGKQ